MSETPQKASQVPVDPAAAQADLDARKAAEVRRRIARQAVRHERDKDGPHGTPGLAESLEARSRRASDERMAKFRERQQKKAGA